MRTGVERSGNRRRSVVDGEDADDFKDCCASASKRSVSVETGAALAVVEDFSAEFAVVVDEITLGAGEPSMCPAPPNGLNAGATAL